MQGEVSKPESTSIATPKESIVQAVGPKAIQETELGTKAPVPEAGPNIIQRMMGKAKEGLGALTSVVGKGIDQVDCQKLKRI